VLLPTLPSAFGGPMLFGGVILPLLWSGANHSLMGLVNPLLNHYINWYWYVASQLVYGIATSIVILRSEKIVVPPRGPGSEEGGPSIPPGWIGCFILICTLLSGCSDNLPGKPALDQQYVMPQKVTDFKQLFTERCAGCHGADGTLGPGPPLNDPLFLALISDADLQNVIANGRSGTLMPAWSHAAGGPLTDEQIAALVKGLKQWQNSGDKPIQQVFPSAPPLTANNGTAGNAQAGAKVYAAACASCHGEHGEGVEEQAGAINNAAFLQLCSDVQLRRYIITGRTDLGMPNFAGDQGRDHNFKPLSAQNVNDLTALLATWRKNPAQ
jgi:cytochrome c oxidase cbb3-type subunit III